MSIIVFQKPKKKEKKNDEDANKQKYVPRM